MLVDVLETNKMKGFFLIFIIRPGNMVTYSDLATWLDNDLATWLQRVT